MGSEYHDSQLEAYLDESLPVEEMAAIEAALRDQTALRDRLMAILQRRDAGIHSLGAIWRRNRLSCPTREELSAYLAETMPHPMCTYIRFHLEVVGCRYCQANLEDLQQKHRRPAEAAQLRSRLHASGAGLLRQQGRS